MRRLLKWGCGVLLVLVVLGARATTLRRTQDAATAGAQLDRLASSHPGLAWTGAEKMLRTAGIADESGPNVVLIMFPDIPPKGLFSPSKGGAMGAFDLFNDQRLTGVLLILAFISFAIGGTLPVVGEKGNTGIFTLPMQEHLLAVADNAIVWRWANIFMGTAAVVLLAGLSMLTTILEGANERAFSRLGLVGFLLAAVLWVIFSAFRAVVTVRAAQEMTTTGAVPTYYEPLAQWGFVLFYIYAAVGFLALAAYGVSLLQVGLLPAWTGWATLIFSIAMLVLLLIMGDTLPAFHYLPTLLIGILLMFRG